MSSLKRELKDWEFQKNEFIKRTDRHSLKSQITNYVKKAEEAEAKALQRRREDMRSLLESEQTVLEEEFEDKVKNSVMEGIKKRHAVLESNKERLAAERYKFVESKRLQQVLTNCYEIRELIRRRETEELKRCQQEQILNKERALRNQPEQDKYWAGITLRENERQEYKERERECCRRQEQQNWLNSFRQYLQENAVRNKLEKERILKEREEIAQASRDLDKEELKRKLAAAAQTLKYRNELLQQIDEHKKLKAVKKLMDIEFQSKAEEEVRRLEESEKRAGIERARVARQSTLEFLQYTRRVQQYKQQKQQIADERYDDLYCVTKLTKENLGMARARKAKENALYYDELRRQACDQKERRILEEKALKEGMTENVFVKDEPTPEMLKADKLKFRKELDTQMEDIKHQRKLAEERYERDLESAAKAQQLCEELAKAFVKDDIDFLQPHPFWIPIACTPSRCTPNKATREDPPAEGFGVKPCVSQGYSYMAREIANCNAENTRPGEFGDAFLFKR